jgi:hypothetical protein
MSHSCQWEGKDWQKETSEDVESLHILVKKRRVTKKGKSKTFKAEEDENKKISDRWRDEEAVALISLREEMNDKFNQNLKKQGISSTIIVSIRFLSDGFLEFRNFPSLVRLFHFLNINHVEFV